MERRWCSVYLMVDEGAFDAGRIQIAGYFTLSHKTLIPSTASKRNIQHVSGFKDSASLHFVLIGQLGKYMARTADGRLCRTALSSRELLDAAFSVIRASSAYIPCRCVMVECSDNKKVQKAYTDYAFKFFQFDGEHYQFYKVL